MEYPLSSTYGQRLEYFLQSADDYHRHRLRINKRLGKLRKLLKIETKDTKNYKEKEQVSSIDASKYNENIRYGEVLLLEAERDLAHSEETKLLLDVHTSRAKHHFLISKYKKALKVSKRLVEASAGDKDEFRRLEVLVYTAFIDGSLAVARKKWNQALNAYSIARCSLVCLYRYQELPGGLSKELYMDLIDNIVDPVLKVASASASAGDVGGNLDVTLIAKGQADVFSDMFEELAPAVDIIRSKDASLVTISDESTETPLDSITWSSYSARVRSDDEARAIMKAQQAEKAVESKDVRTYDEALISFQDALTIHSQTVQRDEYASDDDKQENEIVRTYLQYSYLILRVRRDVTLLNVMEKKKSGATRHSVLERARGSIKVIDGIVKSIEEIEELPGVSNDDDQVSDLTTLRNYFTTTKISKLADAYLAVHKTAEALALLNEASRLIDSSADFVNQFPPTLPTSESLQALKKLTSSKLQKTHVLAVYSREQGQSASNEYIIDNVNKFPTLSADEIVKRVAPLTLTLEPVNVKPVLFDIAFNYIDSEDTVTPTVATDTSEVSKEGEKKKGFFGLFGR